jgi:C-terminal processing protease CtpA/Prc
MLIVSLGRLLITASLALSAAQQPRSAAPPDSLQRLRIELQRVTLAQQEIARDIRLASTAARRASNEAERASSRARLVELGSLMQRTFVESEALRARLQELCTERPGPTGYLGVSFSEVMDMTVAPTATHFVFRKYPTVVSVEPGSPAQKAGLLSGDEIVTIAGQDLVSGPIDITAVFKAGTTLPLRFRRAGELRTMNILLERRPEGFVSGCPFLEVSAGPVLATEPGGRIIRTPTGFGYVFQDSTLPRTGARSGAVAVEGRAPQARVFGTPVLPPSPYAPLLPGAFQGNYAVIGGAVFTQLSEALREGLGVEEGVLVSEVLPASPAMEVGLRAGDVVTQVNGQKATTITGFMTLFEQSGAREVELQVWRRNARMRSVKLRP